MREIVSGVYSVVFEIGQMYIWDWHGGLTLIDTGLSGSSSIILESIATIQRQPEDVREIILTHFHDDHVGGAAELVQKTGARALAHRLDAPVIEGRQSQLPAHLEEFEVALAASTFPKVPHAEPVHVARGLEEGDAVEGGGVVVHVPGHTPGSIAIYVPAAKLLFTGDSIASHDSKPMLGVFNVDRRLAIESVRRQAELDCNVACFGHGEPLVGGAGQHLKALSRGLKQPA